MDRYVLLDFCETVVDFQTFDAFLEYILHLQRPMLYRVCKCKALVYILNKLTSLLAHLGYQIYLKKLFLIACTIGLTKDIFYLCGRSFYENVIVNHFIEETLQLIERFKQENVTVIIISGGSKFYIEYFAKQYGIQHIISAEILFRCNHSMGWLSQECLGKEKITVLDDYMQKHNLSGDYIYAVTDSESDLPIIERAEKAIIISHQKHKEWVDENMEEIIWG